MTTETQQDCPMTAKPQREHEWLRKLIGEWVWEGECNMGTDQPPWKPTGTERVRGHGELWVIGEGESDMPDGGKTHNIITIGFDPRQNCFVGSFVTSVMAHLWVYERGELSDDKRTLSLYVKGPNMAPDAKDDLAQYKDVIELKDDNHRSLTSHIQNEDGSWTKFMRADYRRVK